jgi:hypothetical protein
MIQLDLGQPGAIPRALHPQRERKFFRGKTQLRRRELPPKLCVPR